VSKKTRFVSVIWEVIVTGQIDNQTRYYGIDGKGAPGCRENPWLHPPSSYSSHWRVSSPGTAGNGRLGTTQPPVRQKDTRKPPADNCDTVLTSCARGDTICPRPSPPLVGAQAPRAPPSRRNEAVLSHAQYVPTLTAAGALRVKAALSKAAWRP